MGTKKAFRRPLSKRETSKSAPLQVTTAIEKPDPTPLLLALERHPQDVRGILTSYGVTDVEQADRNLQSMAGDPHERHQLVAVLPSLMESIARTADPDQALNHWERLLENVTRSTFLDYLRSSPRMLDLLSTIFGNSDSLAFTIIRDPMLVYWLADEDVLSKASTRAGLEHALQKQLARLTVKELKLVALRRFRHNDLTTPRIEIEPKDSGAFQSAMLGPIHEGRTRLPGKQALLGHLAAAGLTRFSRRHTCHHDATGFTPLGCDISQPRAVGRPGR